MRMYWILGILIIISGCSGEIMKKDNMTDYVTKQCGTEPAFNNAYWDNHEPGIYVDVNTGEALFTSLDKFDSGTGWPSFTKPIVNASIEKKEDTSAGMPRTEVRTKASHLGHVFDDGPNGSQRYCINSASLRFIPYDQLTGKYAEYKDLFPYETATLAGGCFWGVEKLLEDIPGVISATSGYTGGTTKNPTYEQVSTGKTGHYESVQVVFDPNIITYKEILDYFWRLHDPTQTNGQGPDIGNQYRSAIFYNSEEQRIIAEQSKQEFDNKHIFPNPVATQIIKATTFYPAEEYHQDYYGKNPGLICHGLRPE
jgi:peptide methionine sulfoxide reductase msrA/msrB